MKNFIFIIGICVFVLGLGMSACKSKKNAISGELTSSYELTKINENLVEKKWKLIEINGVALSPINPQPAIEVFIIFKESDNIVNGSSGCNNFVGTYKLGPGSALHFSGIASTRKMCIDMTIEDQMNKIFQTVDNYTLKGNTLSLNQAETALARFAVSE